MRYRLTHSAQTSRAQVMTPPRLARRVVEFLSGSDDAWLELGSGTGNIAQQCLDLKSPREYVGVELDKQLLREVPLDSRAQFLEGDVLSPRGLSNLLGDSTFSRTIGNRP